MESMNHGKYSSRGWPRVHCRAQTRGPWLFDQWEAIDDWLAETAEADTTNRWG